MIFCLRSPMRASELSVQFVNQARSRRRGESHIRLPPRSIAWVGHELGIFSSRRIQHAKRRVIGSPRDSFAASSSLVLTEERKCLLARDETSEQSRPLAQASGGSDAFSAASFGSASRSWRAHVHRDVGCEL